MTIISELGHNIGKFEKSHYFTSWLRLAPNNKISGGKKISSRVPIGSSILKNAFRNAANTIGQNKKPSSIKNFYKRIAYKKGREAAVTATARKLAIIVWHMLTHKVSYKPMDESIYNTKIRNIKLKKIKAEISKFGITLDELSIYNQPTIRQMEVVR